MPHHFNSNRNALCTTTNSTIKRLLSQVQRWRCICGQSTCVAWWCECTISRRHQANPQSTNNFPSSIVWLFTHINTPCTMHICRTHAKCIFQNDLHGFLSVDRRFISTGSHSFVRSSIYSMPNNDVVAQSVDKHMLNYTQRTLLSYAILCTTGKDRVWCKNSCIHLTLTKNARLYDDAHGQAEKLISTLNSTGQSDQIIRFYGPLFSIPVVVRMNTSGSTSFSAFNKPKSCQTQALYKYFVTIPTCLLQ